MNKMNELNPVPSALELRRSEVAEYETQIAMYKVIVAQLPSEWPERLLQFKNSTEKHSDITKIADLNDVELVSDLWAHDDAQGAIRANTVEKRKAEAILAVLEAQAI
jgi:hypothetical protein